jgi:hypothetical protein
MRFTFLIATLFLGACVQQQLPASPEQLAQQRGAATAARQEADRTRCLNYGFQEGTDAYAQCRMTIDQQRQAIAAEMIARAPQPPMPSPLSLIAPGNPR